MPSLPSLGSTAPDFEANTTMGPIRLSDYKGKWVVLFSHPGDFTPVCTTEFICFAKYYDEFQKRNTDLIGLSVDSNSSHLAWIYNICTLTGIDIPFPIIDDSSTRIARLYGMISEPVSNTTTVRSVFIIDDKQVLRTILYYPMTTGRNIPEIIRIIDALQTSDRDNVVTPANWLPGMPVVLPPPKTCKELKNRFKSCSKEYQCMDWYLCFMPEANSKKNATCEAMNYMNRPPINAPGEQKEGNPNCPNLSPIVMEYVFGNPKNVDPRFLDAVIYASLKLIQMELC